MKLKKYRMGYLGLSTWAALLCGGCDDPEVEKVGAVTIYTGGPIITMEDDPTEVTAVAVAGGRISGVGTLAQLQADNAAANITTVQLGGKTLVPSFIDGHSHFFQAAQIADYANVSAPPVGTAASNAQIVAVLEAHRSSHPDPPGGWLIGYGYDQTALPGTPKDTFDALNAAFGEAGVAVILVHVSGHGAMLNQVAQDQTTLTAGEVVDGLVMENPWFAKVLPKLPVAGPESLAQAQEMYASAGYTTVQDAPAEAGVVQMYREAAAAGALWLDVVAYAAQTELTDTPDSAFSSDYSGHFRLGGVKLVVDGSPQGGTALFRDGYLPTDSSGAQPEIKRVTPRDATMSIMAEACARSVQILAHANGDAAIQDVLDAQAAATEAAGRACARTVVVHSQFVRHDQLQEYVKYGIVPSFFTNHAYFWGDVHVKLLGEERAHFLSPLKTAQSMGLHATNHSDFLVTPLDPMHILWSAVNRVCRDEDHTIGEDEKVSARDGLRALTIDGAWQYGEEDQKGSIRVGKLADFAILDKNPLTVEAMDIRGISVTATIKEGQQVWPR